MTILLEYLDLIITKSILQKKKLSELLSNTANFRGLFTYFSFLRMYASLVFDISYAGGQNMENTPFVQNEQTLFESSSHQNGMLYWWASELVKMLGYTEYKPTMTPVQKALQVCMSTNIDTSENMLEMWREVDGKHFKDFKLSRFACYLVAMNADVKKKPVAKLQAYFAAFATAIQSYINSQEDIERVSLRTEITEHEKTLSSTAKMAGVQNYAFFQNKGYLGMYNMSLAKIKRLKGVPEKKPLFDYMGAEEMGANIFRITQTEAKIKREGITGQMKLEQAAQDVGKGVRKAIADIGGTMPEDLPAYEDIKKIKSDLKKTNKAFAKNDKKQITEQ